ncbi:hypothetical protein Unana1_04429 [Umbelopsis nana]
MDQEFENFDVEVEALFSTCPQTLWCSVGTLDISSTYTQMILSSLIAVAALSFVQTASAWSSGKLYAENVLIISIDGMHQQDLTNWVHTHPNGPLAGLVHTAIQYTNVSAPAPADSFPTTIAQFTGATPKTSGVWYDVSYDRTFYPPGSNCKGPIGTVVDFSEALDIDSTVRNGGGGINTTALPQRLLNGKCQVVWPHQYSRVNNIFEVAKKAGLRTAYADKHLSYDIVRGPSGKGLDELYVPEVAATEFTGINGTEAWDNLHTQALINWMNNKSANGTSAFPRPNLYGANFQTLVTAQTKFGYKDGNATPTPEIEEALTHTDAALGQVVASLKSAGLFNKTIIVLGAKHGESPIDPTLRKDVASAALTNATNVPLANIIADTAAYVWLQGKANQAKAAQVEADFKKINSTLKIQNIWGGAEVTAAGWGNPLIDPRVPDIIIQPENGVVFDTTDKEQHGGIGHDDRHVPLIISHPSLHASTINVAVTTEQIAPTILRLLGLHPHDLQSYAADGTRVLPGI